jgi:hypothetical protein
MKASRPGSVRSTRSLRHPALLLAPLFLALLSSAAHADQVVPGTSDIWLAGQPIGSTLTGFAIDTAPANSPIAITLTGNTLTFSITGYSPVTVDGGCFDANADGGECYSDEFGFSGGPANGISLAHLGAGSLVGVFVAAGGPSGPTPSDLDFTDTGLGTAFTSLSPEIDQLFFIGDGLTGTGSGTTQTFLAPIGATTLYLAVADSVGSSTGNSGSITVDVSQSGGAPSAVPEPGALSLVGLGCAGMARFVRRRK